MPRSLLEVIALDATDARNASAGGADRVELVGGMEHDGLTPTVATFSACRAAVDLPIRVMLRDRPGFAVGDPDRLRHDARALRAAGADEFVLGFLAAGAVDTAAVRAVLDVLDGCRWTFHRAIDHATDRSAARRALAGLPGLDHVLTAGAPTTVDDGLTTLVREGSRAFAGTGDVDEGDGPRCLVGGGLRERHLPDLLAAGLDAFHTGSAVRPDGRWDAPVDPDAVRRWRSLLDAGH